MKAETDSLGAAEPPSLHADVVPSPSRQLPLPLFDLPPDPAATAISERLSLLAAREQWHDWRWQMRNRIRNVDGLRRHFRMQDVPAGLEAAEKTFAMAITPYYASLMRRFDETDPVYLQSVPHGSELLAPGLLFDDPLEEDHDMAVPGLVHRYPDRALLIATSTCAMYCRHCTRKRVAGARETTIGASGLKRIVKYLSDHPEIHDVIVSGGDPLTMDTAALERVLAAVRSVPSVDVIRIGTRTPVTMPMRITDELVAMLKNYQPLWINTHFNHPQEFSPLAAAALARLADGGIPLGNQSVLLRGINDDPKVIEELCRGLVKMRVRPYYLYQCDLVRGVEHFRTPLARGLEVMEYLRGRLSGFAIPTFVVDAPGGGGKIPVAPTYVISMSPTHTVLRNAEGMLVSYPEPQVPASYWATRQNRSDTPTVYDLASGGAVTIRPARSSRLERRSGRTAACAQQALGTD